MKIQVLGTDRDLCHALSANAEKALKQLHLRYTLEKVTDLERIVGMGVMAQPALVIDGEIVSSGNIPSAKELAILISSLRKKAPEGRNSGVSDVNSPCSTTELTKKEKESLKGMLASEKIVPPPRARLIKWVILLLFVVGIVFVSLSKIRRPEAQEIPATEAQSPVKVHRLFVYFFHASQQNESFTRLEEMTRTVIETKYAQALSKGRIIFSRVNLEDPANVHFVRDFQVKSPVVVLQKGARFERLDSAPNLMDDPDRLSGYIVQSIGKLQ